MKRSYIREMLDCIEDTTISFAGGLPNEQLFDLEGITRATVKALETPKALQYSKSQGLKKLRQQIATIYTQKFNFPTHEDEILITTGSQQAYDVILKIHAKDEMIIQNPSYIGAINSFKSMGLEIKGFNTINDLKRLLNRSNDLYLMSDFSNPTSMSYSKEERLHIASILKSKGNILIEDGAYTLLNFDGKINRPISSDYDNSFHLGSFSKILAPGLRVGWIRANKRNIEKILSSKESIDLHTPTLNQMIIEHYLQENDLEEHLNVIRNDYKNRMEFMNKCMTKYLKEFTFIKPEGGMFIYGTFKNIDTMKLAESCLENGVAFVPAQVFDPKGKRSCNARFNFTNCSYKQIIKGVKMISKILQKENKDVVSRTIWLKIFKNVAENSKYKTIYI